MKLSEYLKKKKDKAPHNYIWIESCNDGAMFVNRISKESLTPYLDFHVYETKDLDQECLTNHNNIIVPLELKISPKGQIYVS